MGFLVQEKFNIDCQDGSCDSHLGYLIQMILAIFALQITQYFLPSFQSVGILVHKKFKIDLQDGSHLGFLIGTILVVFHLQIAPIRPTKFHVSWPFGPGEEVQNRFSTWLL